MKPVKDIITSEIEKALTSIADIEFPPVRLEYAREEQFGDYACTTAMDKNLREAFAAKDPRFKNPKVFAEELKNKLTELNKKNNYFEKIEVAGPGFLNLTLSSSFLLQFVKIASLNEKSYGHSKKDKPEQIIFEFVSANPTGPLNVVSARAAALGDSCCNLLEAAGDKVHREFYVNDYGNQVNLLGQSCLIRYLESQGAIIKFSKKNEQGEAIYEKGPGIPFPSEGYHGEYLKEITATITINNKNLIPPKKIADQIIKLSKEKEMPSNWLQEFSLTELSDTYGIAASSHFLETQKKDLKNFRVSFDNFYSERSLHEGGLVLKAADSLTKHIFKEEGKTLFRSTDYGDDKDRVIIREDGRPTYLLADIAYHKTKIDRKFNKIINIWGPDHHGYIKRLAGAMNAMGCTEEQFRVLIAQQVNLLENGQPIVMSKRTGKFITMETLIEEIPVDVSRYFFVMRAFESHLDFDFAEAKDTSDKNPYYYVAYAHARIRSIFSKAESLGLFDLAAGQGSNIESLPAHFAITPERRRLMWLVARFPEEIRDAAESLEPHRLINYLYNLASALSKFYAPKENRVIDQDKETAMILLTILGSVAVCLKNGLSLLGMEAPERMHKDQE